MPRGCVGREWPEGARHIRREGVARMRPGDVRVPVQEGEGEEAGLLQGRTDQLPPEGEEGLTEVPILPAVLTLEAAARADAQGILREVSHRQREAVLAAVAPVESAHRHAQRPGQLRGLHVLVPPTRQQPRRLAHGVDAHLLQNPHAPSPCPSGRLSAGRNLPSTRTGLPGGSDMG
jgi:hypothetical protein